MPKLVEIAQVRLVNNEGLILILQRAKNGLYHPGKWTYPGGHREMYDQSLEAAAIRECFEEAGIEAKITGVYTHFITPGKEPDTNLDCTIFSATSELYSVVLNVEHDAYRWVREEELKELGLR